MMVKSYLLCKTNLSKLGEVALLSNVQKLTQRFKENYEIRDMFQTKEQDKFPQTNISFLKKVIY